MNEQTIDYRPGDIANGHVLTADGQWVPVNPAVATAPTPWFRRRVVAIPAAVLTGLFLLGTVGAMAGEAETGSQPAASATQESAAQEAADNEAAEEEAATQEAAAQEAAAQEAAEAEEAAAQAEAEKAAEEESSSGPAILADQKFTQPGDDRESDAAFVMTALMSPSIDSDKGWTKSRILGLGGEAAKMYENGASDDEVVEYLTDNDMTYLSSYFFLGAAVNTYCSADAQARFSD